MKAFLALTRRELGVYFVSPMAYIILTALLVISGLVFVSTMGAAAANQEPVDYRGTLQWLMMILVPYSLFRDSSRAPRFTASPITV